MTVNCFLCILKGRNKGMWSGERGQDGENGGQDGLEVVVEESVWVGLWYSVRVSVDGKSSCVGYGQECKCVECSA